MNKTQQVERSNRLHEAIEQIKSGNYAFKNPAAIAAQEAAKEMTIQEVAKELSDKYADEKWCNGVGVRTSDIRGLPDSIIIHAKHSRLRKEIRELREYKGFKVIVSIIGVIKPL